MNDCVCICLEHQLLFICAIWYILQIDRSMAVMVFFFHREDQQQSNCTSGHPIECYTCACDFHGENYDSHSGHTSSRGYFLFRSNYVHMDLYNQGLILRLTQSVEAAQTNKDQHYNQKASQRIGAISELNHVIQS